MELLYWMVRAPLLVNVLLNGRIQGVPSDFSDGVDNDSLANVSCPSDDMILSYTGGSWTCGYDDVLDSADVIAVVEGEVVNLQDGSQMGSVENATTDDLVLKA